MKRLILATRGFRCLILAIPVLMAACGPLLGQAGFQPSICAPGWSNDFANHLAGEADALPADAAAREALAQLVELRKALPRC